VNEIISDLSMEELLSHVKNFVTRNYDLKPLEVALIEDGIASLNFHVKTEAVSFIIRCDQRRSHQIVKSDEDYILAAKANGVEVPPLPILVEEFFGTAISGVI
jgi:hypothetical protein